MSSTPDFAYANSFLKRLNEIEIDGKNISHFFDYEGYNLWHFYQSGIFHDLLEFSKEVTIKKGEMEFPWRALISGGFFFILSLKKFIVALFYGKNVFVYGIDRYGGPYGADPRMEELYRFLNDKNIRFVEILHSYSGKMGRANFWKRKRFSMYVEGIDFLWNFLSIFGLTSKLDQSFINKISFEAFGEKNEQDFARGMIYKYGGMRALSIFKIKIYKKIFRILKPKAIFLIDDGRRHYYELLLAARMSGVESIALQHGQFNKYFLLPWKKNDNFALKYSAPDKYYLWSDYWKEELRRNNSFINDESVYISGYPQKSLPKINLEKKEGDIYVILPYETVSPKTEVLDYIKKILECKNVKLVFKLRPGASKESQLNEYGLDGEIIEKIIVEESVDPYFEKNTVAVGVYSTFLYEMILKGIPVGILETTFDHSERMIKNNLAFEIGKDSICDSLKILSSLSLSEREERIKKLKGDQNFTLYGTLVQIGADLKLY